MVPLVNVQKKKYKYRVVEKNDVKNSRKGYNQMLYLYYHLYKLNIFYRNFIRRNRALHEIYRRQ